MIVPFTKLVLSVNPPVSAKRRTVGWSPKLMVVVVVLVPLVATALNTRTCLVPLVKV